MTAASGLRKYRQALFARLEREGRAPTVMEYAELRARWEAADAARGSFFSSSAVTVFPEPVPSWAEVEMEFGPAPEAEPVEPEPEPEKPARPPRVTPPGRARTRHPRALREQLDELLERNEIDPREWPLRRIERETGLSWRQVRNARQRRDNRH